MGMEYINRITVKKDGVLPPNEKETWLDVQARALEDAANLIDKLAKEG